MKGLIQNRAMAVGLVSKLLPSVRPFAFFLVVLFQIETFANPVCSMIFSDQLQQSGYLKVGGLFLHERDSKLHTSPMVEKVTQLQHRLTGARLNKPTEKINSWLNYLNSLAEKAEQSPRSLKQVNEVIYKQFVIKSNEVPQTYYDLQVKIARERGHGNLEVTNQMKAQLAETVIKDQKASIDYWTSYLVSKDTSIYPMWLKYWMFTGMTKLSKYDPQSGTFGNRTKETVAPLPELNREALAHVADVVLKKLNKESLSEINDPEMIKLLDGMSFGKIYGHALLRLGVGKEGQFKSNEGKWISYKQGSDHMPLVKSLEGKNTGWCTAGESTAASFI